MPTNTIQESRTALLNDLNRRRKTIDYSTSPMSFLEAMSLRVGFSQGSPTEVDGDALAILKAVS